MAANTKGQDPIVASADDIKKVLDVLPQKPPFRFVDEILELDSNHIVGTYRFREDEYFYQGHFPDNPVTPGVILIETLAQFAVVSFGIYQRILNQAPLDILAFFTDCEIEFSAVVRPGATVKVFGEKIFYRRGKLKCNARMELEDGSLAAVGTLAGFETDG